MVGTDEILTSKRHDANGQTRAINDVRVSILTLDRWIIILRMLESEVIC